MHSIHSAQHTKSDEIESQQTRNVHTLTVAEQRRKEKKDARKTKLMILIPYSKHFGHAKLNRNYLNWAITKAKHEWQIFRRKCLHSSNECTAFGYDSILFLWKNVFSTKCVRPLLKENLSDCLLNVEQKERDFVCRTKMTTEWEREADRLI